VYPILVCIRWYAAYPLSYRHLEEMMEERGVCVDHSSINRWAIRFLPLLEAVFRNRKRAVGTSWRMDETYIKVKGVWKYLYRAVDKQGQTIDFLLTAKRDAAAATRFFEKAMRHNSEPEKEHSIQISMDGKGCWRDNVFVERLWRSIKYEEVYLYAYDSVSDAKRGLEKYFRLYNQERPHTALDDQTPDEFNFDNLPALPKAA
jgi:transposase-like protein